MRVAENAWVTKDDFSAFFSFVSLNCVMRFAVRWCFYATKIVAICSNICVLKCQIAVNLLSARHVNVMNNCQMSWCMFDVTTFNKCKFEYWKWWKFGPNR